MTTDILERTNVADDALAKKPPYSIPAEQAILGAILLNNNFIDQIGDMISFEHFYEPIHQRIYKNIIQLMDRGLVADPVTLKGVFDKDEDLKDLGGATYLVRLTNIVPNAINLKSYARTIYDLYIRRSLMELGEHVISDALEENSEITAQHQIENVEKQLYNLAVDGVSDNSFVDLRSSMLEALKRTEVAVKRDGAVSGISSGFVDLDKMLGGLQDSDLLILAGRPSMGKTALAINIAVEAARLMHKQHEHKGESGPAGAVGFFSLEMSAEQIAGRIIAMECKVNASKLRTGDMSDDDFTELSRKSKDIYSLPLFIDDTPALSISALRTRARRLKRKNNLKLLLVDYLQLVRGSNASSMSNRVQEVSEVTQGLKAIAKELDIPVIALSQLSRAVESRDDKRPQLSDLRESGSIEQDADIVMFIYREEYYIARECPSEDDAKKTEEWQAKMETVKDKAEVMIAKQRHGPIGNVQLYFNASFTKFGDLSKRDSEFQDLEYKPRS